MVRIDPPEEQRRRSRLIQALDAEWTQQQIERGVDGSTPDTQPEVSDYNQHVPALESDADAEDEFWRRMKEIG